MIPKRDVYPRPKEKMAEMKNVPNKPCSGCPYRKDCPSGVWAEHEYLKLIEYDNETGDQPPAAFHCHDGDREDTLCRGWLDTHNIYHLLSMRMIVAMGLVDNEIFDLPKSDVPCFASGLEAHDHGMKEIENPSNEAVELQQKLKTRHPQLEWMIMVADESD